MEWQSHSSLVFPRSDFACLLAWINISIIYCKSFDKTEWGAQQGPMQCSRNSVRQKAAGISNHQLESYHTCMNMYTLTLSSPHPFS